MELGYTISVDWEGLQSGERLQWGSLLGCAGCPPGICSWFHRLSLPGSFRDGAPTCAPAPAAELLLLRAASLPGDTIERLAGSPFNRETGSRRQGHPVCTHTLWREQGQESEDLLLLPNRPLRDPLRQQVHWDLEAGCPGRVLMEAPKTGSLAAWVCLNISSSPGA